MANNDRRPKHPVRDWLITGLITLALAEIMARVLQGHADNGMPTFLRQPLLPFRPDSATLEKAFKKVAMTTYLIPDDELGWVVGKNGKTDDYESNSQGVRAPASRVYSPTPPEGKVRIVTLGDSFTHCDDVKNEDTWEVALEGLRRDLEVLNLGVPAFGTDQALLRYRRDGIRFSPQISILGIWTEDVCRNLNLVHYYLNPASVFMSKPRFLLTGGKLEPINYPVMPEEVRGRLLAQPEEFPVLKDDYWYSPSETTPKLYQHSALLRAAGSLYTLYQRKMRRENLYLDKDPSAIELAVAIAKQFAKEAEAAGAKPIILLIPMRHHLDQKKMYTTEDSFPLARALRRQQLVVIDLGFLLSRDPALDLDQLFLRKGGHISPAGNRRLALELEKKLAPWIEKAKNGPQSSAKH
jgi:hypothetical protein